MSASVNADVITCRPMPDAISYNIVRFYLVSLICFLFFSNAEAPVVNLKRTCLRPTLQESVSGNFHVRQRDAGVSAPKTLLTRRKRWRQQFCRETRRGFPLYPLQDSEKSPYKKGGEFSTNECACESPRVCASENESGRSWSASSCWRINRYNLQLGSVWRLHRRGTRMRSRDMVVKS